jgi:AcrR family transcriptional regulator
MVPAVKCQHHVNARERIIQTALNLFYRNGLRATGIDKIIAEAGVAKMSFYRYFPSKDDLVAEFLRRRHDIWMAWFTAAVNKRLGKSNSGLEVIADVLDEWFDDPEFRGCAFINTISETPEYEAEQNHIVRDHKAQLELFVKEIASQLRLKTPGTVAAKAMIVIEGAIVRAQMTRDPDVTSHCRNLLLMIACAR